MKVSLRPMTDKDLELIMVWRSNPDIYGKGAYTQRAPLVWEEHYTWFATRGHWWKFFVIVVDDEKTRPRDVGIVNFGQLDNWNPEYNYYLGEASLWGQGVGKQALSLGIEWLKRHGYCKLHTTVKDDNERSMGIMTSLGFVKTGPARVGESCWEMVLSDQDKATEYTSGRKPFMSL